MSEGTRASFLFFASGILASAGVNLLTSLAGSESLRPAIIALWASQWLCSSAALAIAASYLDSGAREAQNADQPELSQTERDAIRRQVVAPYIKKATMWGGGGVCFLTLAVVLIFVAPADRSRAEALKPQTGEAQVAEHIAKRVVIVHGTFGSPDSNWSPWLAAELRKRGVRVDVPQFPTPEGQSISSWKRAFEVQVGDVTPDMVFVGHSLGPAFIVRLLESTPHPVAGVFFVAPFMDLLKNERFDVPNKTFVEGATNWDAVKTNAGFVRIYGSDNDPYVPVPITTSVAKHLGVDVSLIKGGGHLNTAAGYQKFPLLLEEILSFLAK